MSDERNSRNRSQYYKCAREEEERSARDLDFIPGAMFLFISSRAKRMVKPTFANFECSLDVM